VEEKEEGEGGGAGSTFSTFYADFLLLFQVKTTKGILLFLLFCVLSSVIVLTICVGFLWIHRQTSSYFNFYLLILISPFPARLLALLGSVSVSGIKQIPV
jgi:hypothetical protein